MNLFRSWIRHTPHSVYQSNASYVNRVHRTYAHQFFPKTIHLQENCLDAQQMYMLQASLTHLTQTEQKSLHGAHCLLSVSVGQKAHEDQHLASTLALCMQKRFASYTFVLGDVLQRHTLGITASNHSPEILWKETEQKGDAWLHRNIHLLSQISAPWTIKRWDFWLNHARFAEQSSVIEHAQASDATYRSAFEKNIDIYLERLKKRNAIDISEDQARQLCMLYLKEECAAMLLWVETGCHYELYPSGRTLAMQATYEQFIAPKFPDLLKPLALRFKNVLPKKTVDDSSHTGVHSHGLAKR